MYVVDSHCDSLRDFGNGIPCNLIKPYNFSSRYSQLQFVAMFCGRAEENEAQSYDRAKRYLSTFKATVKAEKQRIVCIKNYSDIEKSIKEEKHAVMLTAEGAAKGILGGPDLVREFYNAGVRVIGLAWDSTSLVTSNRISEGECDLGLTESGRLLANEIDSLGMFFDVSHLSDKSFFDIADIATKPLIATHSNFRKICPHTRNLTDEMARLIFDRDGMIGLNFFPPFISEAAENRTVEGLFMHLDYGLSLGGENHIGFGGDIDGTSGRYPYPLDENSSMHDKIIEMMLSHNYSEDLVRKIAGENYLRFLKKYL